ncbi:hypothetical protein [Bacillus cereus]|uniref:hypothetical protein n=1 Tax=Bacillus cereus TaxID=1396 RepID=UPI00159BE76B|nr:hypothetical protein [Bacillus cereus]
MNRYINHKKKHPEKNVLEECKQVCSVITVCDPYNKTDCHTEKVCDDVCDVEA